MTTRGAPTRVWVVEHLGGDKATWECAAGHRWTMALLPKWGSKRKGPGRGGPKRVATNPGKVSEAGFALMARWWRKEAGGVSGTTCPECEALNRREDPAQTPAPP